MPKVQVKGLDDLIPMYEDLTKDTEAILKQGLYDGAKELADALSAAVASLPVEDGRAPKGGKKSAINTLQKKGLQDSLGVSKMESGNNSIYLSIGFKGYNGVKTKKYPNGQPNQMIARSLEKGTDYLTQNRFVRPVINKARARAIEAMKKTISKSIKERT